MPLPIPTNSGGDNDSLPFIKYNAKAGRMILVDRSADASGTWTSQETDVTDDFQVAVDIANCQVGWMAFPPGQAPQRELRMISDVEKNGMPPQPAWPNAKPGVLIHVWRKPWGVREISGNSGIWKEVVNDIYMATVDANAPELAQGKVPVVKMTGTRAIKSTHGTNYAPKLEVVSWIDSPFDPIDTAPATPEPAPARAPAPTRHAPAPAAAAQASDGDDF